MLRLPPQHARNATLLSLSQRRFHDLVLGVTNYRCDVGISGK